MFIAGQETISNVTDSGKYGKASAANRAALKATNGKLPCYAINGTRKAFKWVSVGSSAVISRGNAAEWFARYGADLDAIEQAALMEVA